jgi:hypothetical protein
VVLAGVRNKGLIPFPLEDLPDDIQWLMLQSAGLHKGPGAHTANGLQDPVVPYILSTFG